MFENGAGLLVYSYDGRFDEENRKLCGTRNNIQEMEVCSISFAYLSNELRNLFGVINLLIGLAAFIGNFMAFLVIFNARYFRNRSSFFLGSLMMTDFLVGAVLEPMHVAQLFSEELRNNCKFNTARRYLSTLLIGASIGSVAVISYDRYIHLSRTQTYLIHMCKRKVAGLISIAWLVPTVMPILMTLGKDEKIYSGMIFVVISVYFTIMMLCYIFIVKIVRKKTIEMVQCGKQSLRQQRQVKKEIRAAKVITMVIMCFFVNLIPISIYHCTAAVKAFIPGNAPEFKESARDIFYTVTMTLAIANSGINPLIYYLRNQRFKGAGIQILRKICPVICFSMCQKQRLSTGSKGTEVTSTSV